MARATGPTHFSSERSSERESSIAFTVNAWQAFRPGPPPAQAMLSSSGSAWTTFTGGTNSAPRKNERRVPSPIGCQGPLTCLTPRSAP